MIFKKFHFLTCFLLTILDQAQATAWGVEKERIFYSEEQRIFTTYSISSRLNEPKPLTYQENKFLEYGAAKYLNIGYQDSSEKIIFKNKLLPDITSRKMSGFIKFYKNFYNYSSFAVKLSAGRQNFLTHKSSFFLTTIACGTGFRLLEKNNFLELEFSSEKNIYFGSLKQYDLTYGFKTNDSLNMVKLSFLPRNHSREISFSKSFYIGKSSNLVASFFMSKNRDLENPKSRKKYIKKGFSFSVWKEL